MIDAATPEPASGGVEIRRVGPGGSLASDNAFAVALLTLWHRVAESGGEVGFDAQVNRATVGAAVSELIVRIRSGRSQALALTSKRDIVGFVQTTKGTGTGSHTGDIGLLMVDPASQSQGLGSRLIRSALNAAASDGIDRVRVEVGANGRLENFFQRFGFVEQGRLPGWIRRTPGVDRDEVLMVAISAPDGFA